METRESKYEWMYSSFPELRLFDSDDERRAALKGVQRQLFGRNWRFWLYGGAVMLGSTLVAPPAARVVLSYGTRWGISTWVLVPVMLAVLILVYYWGIGLLWERSVQRFLRQRLRAAGIAVCLSCGYDLRGTESPRCPECGQDSSILPSRRDVL